MKQEVQEVQDTPLCVPHRNKGYAADPSSAEPVSVPGLPGIKRH